MKIQGNNQPTKADKKLIRDEVYCMTVGIIALGIMICCGLSMYNGSIKRHQYEDTITRLEEENQKLNDRIKEQNEELDNLQGMSRTMSYITSSRDLELASPNYQDIVALGLDKNTHISLVKLTQWDSTENSINNTTGANNLEMEALLKYIAGTRGIEESNPILYCAEELVTVEREYNISATAILSILTWESGFATTWPDEYKWNNNPAGINNSDGSAKYFNSVNECILYLGELLESYTVDHGLSSWTEIGEKYCDIRWSESIPDTITVYNSYMKDIIKLS